jgi:hypothetical protein
MIVSNNGEWTAGCGENISEIVREYEVLAVIDFFGKSIFITKMLNNHFYFFIK